jgi:WD40 repeat protein
MRSHLRRSAAALLFASLLFVTLSAQEKPATVEFKGHTEAIYSVGFNKDGTLAVTGSFDKSVRLWDPATGKQLREFSGPAGHQSLVLSVAFNPAGDQIASGGSDNFARVWDVPLSKPVRELVQTAGVNAVAVTADGKLIAGAAKDGSVKLWAADGKVIATLTGHVGGATVVAFSTNGQTLATAGADGTLRFWNADDGKPAGVVGAHASPITGVAISPSNNQAFTVGEDGLVKFWQMPIPADKPLPGHAEAINTLILSTDGNSVLTGGADKALKLSNVGNGQLIREFAGVPAAITSAAFLANGVVAAGTADGKVALWTQDGKLTATFAAHAGAVTGIAMSGNTLVTSGTDGVLRSWAYPISPTRTIAQPDKVLGMIVAPDGKRLLTSNADKTIRVWSLPDGAAKSKIDLAYVPTAIAVSRDGARLVAGGGKSIALFTLADGKPAGTITTPADVRSVALSSDRIAVAAADSKVRLYGPDLKPAGELATGGPVTAIDFLPDGRLVSIGEDKQLRIWDAKTAKEQKAIAAGDAAVVSLSVTADGSKAATAGADKTAKVWTLADGKAAATVALAGPAQAIAVSPNGTRLAIAFADGKANHLNVYDVATGRELQALPQPGGPIRSLSFLPDNRTLLASGDDKAVTVHDVAATSAVPVCKDGVVAFALNPAAAQAITAGADQTVKLWDLATSKEIKKLVTVTEPITALAVSRDFSAFAVTAGKTAKVWQIADGKELASIAHPADVVSVGFSGDKSRLITGAADNLARVWEVATGRLVQTFAHTGAVRGVAMHPSQPLVMTASTDRTAAVHSLVLNRIVAASPKALRAILATPDSARVIVAGDDGVIRVFNAGNGTEERKIGEPTGAMYAIALSKNGQVFAAAGADKTIRLFTFNDGKEVGTIALPAPVRGLTFSADAKLLVGVADDRTVTAWGTAFQPGQPLPDDFGKTVQQFTHGDAVLAAAFTDKGELFTGSADKTVRQWKVAANVPTRNFQHPNLVDAVAWSPDGKHLATACHDGILRVFDVEKNVPIKTINAHTTPPPGSPIYSVTWTTDGKQLLSTSFDKSMKLWDATAGTLVKEFKAFDEKASPKGHTDQVFCAAITKDGKQIVSGGSDRRIKLWNAADGTVIREFQNPEIKGEPGQSHPGGVYQLRFTADEKCLVSAGPAPKNQGYVAVWSVADGKLVRGQYVQFGPVFGVALSPDGKNMLLGCGPKARQVPEAEAVLLPVPATVAR